MKFIVNRDHWYVLMSAVGESIKAAQDAGIEITGLSSYQEWKETHVIVTVTEAWKNKVKEILAYHPEPAVGQYFIKDIDDLLTVKEEAKPSVEKGQGVAEFSLLLALIAVAALLAMAMLGFTFNQAVEAPLAPEAPAIPAFPEHLSDLPLTNHAANGHANSAYNARNLPRFFDDGKCHSYTISYCASDDAFHVVCEVQEGYYAGIIVGMALEQPVIVTAYPGQYAYWQNNINGCVNVTFPPAGLALP